MVRRLLQLLTLMGLAWSSAPVLAVDEADLLPVDQAFVVEASATSRDRIQVRWRIAEGYYLYRHRTSAQVEGGGFQAGPLQLPAGKPHVDEFFGAVETYRGQLQAVLPGQASADARQVTLLVGYQGCADAGICYPPQTRTLTVRLPASAPSGAAWTPGAAASTRGGGVLPPGPGNALPMPEARAFGFDAIAVDGDNLLLRFIPAPGYYLYRDRTTINLHGAPGIAAAAPAWPRGVDHSDQYFGRTVVYFDQVEVPVGLRREHGRAARATLAVTFQGCQADGICYPPMTRSVVLDLPAGTAGAGANLAPAPVTAPPGDPAAGGAATAPVADAQAAALPADPPGPGLGAAMDPGRATDVPRTLPPAEALRGAGRAPASLALALLLALAGGLVLNLMPCVLPVLSLKALSLADSGRSGGHARSSALWYTAGVLLSFMAIGAVAIALRAAGQALGWGFQLQQPLVIGALAYVMFAVGLSLSGVFALGHRFAGAGHSLTGQTGPAGDFFTGVLAVVIASPCTAPFMGAALAFAFTASTPVALLVFLVLGLGLALPFLLIGFIPALARCLPQPGAWMESLKQFLAFPMYLTAVWLLWVLGRQRGIDAAGLALAGMVVLALGLWWYQRLRFQVAPVRRLLALALMLGALVPLVLAQRLQPPAPAAVGGAGAQQALPYSAAALAALRAEGRVVFVEMTADWCVTCKANERAVLDREAFRASLAGVGAVFMRGDWTNVDPRITAFLEAHQAVGVPLYVVFPSDGGQGEVLPTVLTQRLVGAALERAAR